MCAGGILQECQILMKCLFQTLNYVASTVGSSSSFDDSNSSACVVYSLSSGESESTVVETSKTGGVVEISSSEESSDTGVAETSHLSPQEARNTKSFHLKSIAYKAMLRAGVPA